MLYNSTRITILAEEVNIAFTFFTRFKGLMFCKELSFGQALVLAPCRSVHMFFMRFPLDVVFADQDYKVVGIEANLRPWQLSKVHKEAHYAIELPAGTIARTKTQLGDGVRHTLA